MVKFQQNYKSVELSNAKYAKLNIIFCHVTSILYIEHLFQTPAHLLQLMSFLTHTTCKLDINWIHY